MAQEDRVSNIDELKDNLAKFCRFLYMDGLIDHSGHVSARIPGTDLILINPGLISRTAVTAEHLITIDLDGRLVNGQHEPAKETAIHTGIYRARNDVFSVAHLHPKFITLFAIAGKPLIPVCNHGAIFGGQIPLYFDPDHITTEEQGHKLARCLGNNRAVLMRGHGATVVGESILSCFTGCVYLEENARKLFYSSFLGTPSAYSDDEIARVTKSTWNQKSFKKLWDHFETRARAAGVI